jgi:hypothetical protein
MGPAQIILPGVSLISVGIVPWMVWLAIGFWDWPELIDVPDEDGIFVALSPSRPLALSPSRPLTLSPSQQISADVR